MISEAIIIPVIIATIELLKNLGLPKKFSSLVSLLLGMIIGIFYIENIDLKSRIFMGAVYGLSAAGLYTTTKHTIDEFRTRRNKIREKTRNKVE